MAQKYVVTPEGKAFEESYGRKGIEVIPREEMTEFDWAMQQTILLMRNHMNPDNITVETVKEQYSYEDKDKPDMHIIGFEQTQSVMDELLARGWIRKRNQTLPLILAKRDIKQYELKMAQMEIDVDFM